MIIDLFELEPEEEIPFSQVFVNGTVRCKETNFRIPGINVSVQDLSCYDRTDIDGDFYLAIGVHGKGKYTLIFDDVDGPHNLGLFESKTTDVLLSADGYSKYLDIYLEKKK